MRHFTLLLGDTGCQASRVRRQVYDISRCINEVIKPSRSKCVNDATRISRSFDFRFKIFVMRDRKFSENLKFLYSVVFSEYHIISRLIVHK